MKQVAINGHPGGAVRAEAIMDAIAAIQKDGDSALKETYVGVKNYAHFGDQREDHQDGYGPKHGTIVFSIRRQPKVARLDIDAVYYIESYRDFGVVDHPVERSNAWHGEHRKLTLADVLQRLQNAKREQEWMLAFLAGAQIESHELA